MKIVYIYTYFGTPKGGWSTRVYEFTKRWVYEGVQVTVITSPYYKSDIKAKGFIEKQTVEGINLIVINSPDSNKATFLVRLFNAIKFSSVALFYSLTLNYDVIISSSGPITTAVPGLAAKFLRNKKFIFEVRDLWPTGAIELKLITNRTLIKLGLLFEKLCYKNSDFVAACSKGMIEGVQRVFPEADVLEVPNSSDNDLFIRSDQSPANFPKEWRNMKIFIYTGSLGLMDDCQQILKGISFSTRKDIRLAIVGDGAEKSELEKFVNTNGLEDVVRFFGLIPKEEVVKWYNVATASFVTFKNLPVLHTSSPNKMFDSFAAGVPIIQNTTGWIKQLIDRERCGINVAPEDGPGMGRAVDLLSTDMELHRTLSENAFRVGRTMFDRSLVAKRYLDKLIEVCK